jgi:hypothetical protein
VVVQTRSPYDNPDEVVDEMATGLKEKGAGAEKGLEFESVERCRSTVGAVGAQKSGGVTYKKALVAFPSEGFLVR